MMYAKALFIFLLTYSSLLLPSKVSASESSSGAAQVDSIAEFKALLAANKGRVVYVDFWASWCIPCKQSFAWMNDMQKKYQQQDLVIVAVNLDVKRSMANEFIQQHPVDFSILYDPQGRLAKQFKLKGMPSSFIFDRSGKLVQAHTGFFTEQQDQYEANVVAVLNNQSD
ncbi:TlpA disulfide reductase family protein [Thalassotalea ponticola]|uniref:TlpA disulfide reductase family protein n=1 Tax=Thalassotalea ponticola TaxID=1523392 RepID=UPI0025B3D240|nr:TlpA disulfide reductase family protein [Thalassotalea ponticola]MDN3653610.1 TlpA disulfide reductase family protein [Thalassotalea ponticola]